jgi:hypothetical protein
MIIINPMWIIFVKQFGFKLIVSLASLLLPVEKGSMADLAAPKLPFFTGGENIGMLFGTLYLNY